MTSCICGKSKPFTACCGRFLSGESYAKTPEQLMRSRYCAYALGGYGEYLLSTWLPATTHSLTAADLSEKTLDWQRLEILSSSQNGDKGVVEFKAWYRNPDTGKIEIMHETSQFQRIQSRWFYVDGKVK